MKPILLTAILSATALVLQAGDPAPVMLELSQKSAKPGEILTVMGEGLSSKNVDEIYLTDHKFDMRVKVLDQKDTAVKFRVPPFAKPGRMQLLFLSKGADPKLLEQPVYLLIEDPNAEVAETKPAPAPPPTVAPTPTVAPATTKEEPKIEAKADVPKDPVTKPEQNKQDQHRPK